MVFTKFSYFCFVFASFIFAKKCEISPKSLQMQPKISVFFAKRLVRSKPWSKVFLFQSFLVILVPMCRSHWFEYYFRGSCLLASLPRYSGQFQGFMSPSFLASLPRYSRQFQGFMSPCFLASLPPYSRQFVI